MSGEAQKLGLFETLSKDPEAELFYLRNVRSVSREDIQKVVQEFFHGSNLNVVMVMPKGKEPEITVQNLIDMTLSADAQFKPVEVKKAEKKRKIQQVRLKNGLTVLVQEAVEVPTISLQIVFLGGIRYENKETNGIFPFLSMAWTKGTKNMNAQEFAETVDGIGGSIIGFSGQNTFGLQARLLSQNFDKGLQLFLDCLLEPAFSPEEIEKLKPILLAKLKSQEDNLAALSFKEFRRLLFGPHPYGMNPLGSEKVINNVTSAQLRNFWARYARPDTAVLSVVGDVNADSIIQRLQSKLESWHNLTDLSIPIIPKPAILKSPELFAISKDKQQVHLVLGFHGAPFNSEERYPVEVLNAILSGQGGRLFSILRDRDSLAYSVASVNSLGLDYGAFAFYIACSPDKKEEAIKSLWREIYRIMDTPVSTEEIERAKKWIIGNYEIDLQTNDARALDMALNELYGLGYDFSLHYGAKIEKVTKEDIQKAAKKIFTPDRYVLIQVGS
jgi:zinc protease